MAAVSTGFFAGAILAEEMRREDLGALNEVVMRPADTEAARVVRRRIV
jgi:hypothetical protein